MKQILFAIFIGSFIIKINAQSCIGNNNTIEFPCCNQKINIDPLDNTYIVNTERLGMTQNRDINFNNFDVKYLDPSYSLKAINAQNVETFLNNPIFNSNATGEYDMMTNWRTFYDVEKLPMHPKNGWQLMHHYDGWKPFTRFNNPVNMTSFNEGLIGYHYLYYNKYTAKARFVIYPQYDGPYNPSELSLNMKLVKTGTPQPAASAIFNIYNSRLLGLDKPTIADEAKSFLGSNQNVGSINGSFLDFDLYYDPCICNTEPILQIEAWKRTTLNLYAEGKYAGINRQFDKSGKIPSGYGKDWLGSVYGDYKGGSDFEVENGFQVYRTADLLAKQYYVSPDMQALAGAIGLFGKVTNGINIGTGLSLASTIGSFAGAPSFLQDTNKLKIPLGNILSGGAKYLAGQINPDVPNVSFSEGQIALRGKIVGETQWGGFDTRKLIYPGSKNAANRAGPKEYPYYNENVGLFALIYTPKLYFRHKMEQTPNFINSITLDFYLKDKLEYTFNSSSDIDINKSQVYAMIEFDIYTHYVDTLVSNSKTNSVLFDFDKAMYKVFNVNKGFAVVNKVKVSIDSLYNGVTKSGILNNLNEKSISFPYENKSIYVSNKYFNRFTIQTLAKIPIDKLHNYNFQAVFNWGGDPVDRLLASSINKIFFWGAIPGSGFLGSYSTGSNHEFNKKFQLLLDPRLKLFNVYNYFPNRFGVPNTFTNILTYNPDFINFTDNNVKPPVTNFIYPDIVYTSQFNFTPTNNTIIGNNIVIDNVLNYPFPIFINGISSVDIIAGGQVSPNTTVQIIQDPLGHVSLNPLSETALKSFCNSIDYNSKNFSLKSSKSEPKELLKFNLNLLQSLSIQPNPASSVAKLMLTNYHNSSANIKIFDLMGREMLEVIEKDITSREHSVDLDIERLAPGTYIVKVNNGLDEKTTKLVVVRY